MPFSTTITISRFPNKIVIPSGNSVILMYTISGSGTTTANLVRTDGTSLVALACDGSQHTVTFTPTLSQLYFIAVTDANGTLTDRLEIIVQHALTAVDPTALPNITSTKSGLWTDPTVWSGGVLPGVNDVVGILAGHVVKANARRDGLGNILQCARLLNAGTVRVWNDNGTAAALWVSDYEGPSGSVLDIDSTKTANGTVAVMLMRNRPFHANDTAGNSPDGFARYWNAVDIRGGDLTMRGLAITPHARATGDIPVGAAFVDLTTPVSNWAQSYLLWLPDTRGTRDRVNDFTDQGETLVVRGVSADRDGNANRRVYFNFPTRFAHPAARNVDGTLAVRTWDGTPLSPSLTCLSKTAGIISEDPTGTPVGSDYYSSAATVGGGSPRAHVYLSGGGRVDCRDAMPSHGMGRATVRNMQPYWDAGPTSYRPNIHRLFPLFTDDLHGPSGGLGYDSSVDENEFKPADAANLFGLNGPSHRFINCLAMDPFENNTGQPIVSFSTYDPTIDMGIDPTVIGAGGWVHVKTNYGLYKGNIGFNFGGTCWGLIDGSVNRNVFQDNTVSRTDGFGGRLDTQEILMQGSGWQMGTVANWFRGNTSAGAGGFGAHLDQYQFAVINANSVNDNFQPGQEGYFTTWTPNFQGASLKVVGERTGFDNLGSQPLEWSGNEGYGTARAFVFYNIGTSGANDVVYVSTDSVFYRQVFWASFHSLACFPYPSYRFVRSQWCVRADYGQNVAFDVNTDYTQGETSYTDWDCEGFVTLVGITDLFGTQHDTDQPDRGGPGRILVRGGRYVVDYLVALQYSQSSFPAIVHHGTVVVVGGERSAPYGANADVVNVLNPAGGAAVVFLMNYPPVANIGLVDGCNLTSPKRFEVNRWGGHNYDVYPRLADAGEVLPQSYDVHTSPPALATASLWGCPEAGLTNQQCHDKYLPVPAHYANATQALYQGVLKPGQPDFSTPGMCWGGKLTPGTATTVLWITGHDFGAGAVGGKADNRGTVTVPTPPAPVNVAVPTVDGYSIGGSTLRGSRGAWSNWNSVSAFTFQWYSATDGNPATTPSAISGQVGPSYSPGSGDVGKWIRFGVVATNPGGSSSVVLSPPAGPITSGGGSPPPPPPPPAVPVNTAPPSVTGSVQVGSTLTTTLGAWTNTPTSYTIRWTANGTTIAGQTGSTIVTATPQIGTVIRTGVVATNAGGDSTESLSPPVGPVTVPPPPAPPAVPVLITAPVVSGTPVNGQVVTTTLGVWSNTPTSYVIAWYYDTTPDLSQTGQTYSLTGPTVGTNVRAFVVAVNAAGSSVGAFTNSFGPVQPIPGTAVRARRRRH